MGKPNNLDELVPRKRIFLGRFRHQKGRRLRVRVYMHVYTFTHGQKHEFNIYNETESVRE